ncbi:MAG: hypothetical protein ACP5OZ_01085 [Candidatus Woesearchaeota archaeon]
MKSNKESKKGLFLTKNNFIGFLFLILFILVFCCNEVFSIGLTPADILVYYEPDKEVVLNYAVSNTLDFEINASLFVTGELSQYFELSEVNVVLGPKEAKSFYVKYKLPKGLNPGTYVVRLNALEIRAPTTQGVGARASVIDRITIRVPEKGKYIETSLRVDDAELNKTTKAYVDVSNFGEETINFMFAEIEFFTLENKTISKVRTKTYYSLKTFETATLDADFETTGLEKATYKANAIVYYDSMSKETNFANFRIGSIEIKIVDFTRKAYHGLISKFNVTIENRWNTEVNFDLEVLIKKDNKIVQTIRFSSELLKPFETKTISSFLDATNLELGLYDVEANAYYNNNTETLKGNLEIVEVPKEKLESFNYKFIIAILLLLIVLNIIWLFFLKRKSSAKNSIQEVENK